MVMEKLFKSPGICSWNCVVCYGILPILPPNSFFATRCRKSAFSDGFHKMPQLQNQEEGWSWKIKKWSWKCRGKIFCQSESVVSTL